MTDHSLTIHTADVASVLARHLNLYRRRPPHYQAVMLSSLRSLWQGHHARLLDIGGGTGVIAQCMQDLLPAGAVTAVDVVDRFCSGLTVQTRTYDGTRLPFADGSFDAATLNNVVHHIPPAVRLPLFRDIRRVVRGPIYIKDHLAGSALDHARLSALDALGNIPFGGMVSARYLEQQTWRDLAAAIGCTITYAPQAVYRGGLFGQLFPNRLEICMRWDSQSLSVA